MFYVVATAKAFKPRMNVTFGRVVSFRAISAHILLDEFPPQEVNGLQEVANQDLAFEEAKYGQKWTEELASQDNTNPTSGNAGRRKASNKARRDLNRRKKKRKGNEGVLDPSG